MAHARPASNRPLSPHLGIYWPIVTMVASIVHRITGAALYFGMALLAIWFLAAAAGEAQLDAVNAVYGSLPGMVVLFGFTWALMHHALGGVRYLIWDTARGMGLPHRRIMVWINIFAAAVLTVVIWIAVLMMRGGAA